MTLISKSSLVTWWAFSVLEGAPVENVILHVTDKAWNYITTKPLHESQSVLNSKQADGKWEVRLKVQDNYELRSLYVPLATVLRL